MGEFLKVVSVNEARQRIEHNLPTGEQETVFLPEAFNRTLARDFTSPEDLPAFTRSTVDGYAVRAADTFGSSESLPAYLEYAGEVVMGRAPEFELQPGRCAWIPTGGMLPQGADAAVMVEYTEKLGEDTILIYRPVGPGDNLMMKGEDLTRGDKIFAAGRRLRSQEIGLLSSLGIGQVEVLKPYRIGILSTGNEVVEIDQIPGPGEVRDVNSYSLAAAVQSCGALVKRYPLVGDDFNQLKQAAALALEENDLLLLSGGSSVGTMDVTLDVLLDFPDSELLFHGIAVKPGKPTMAVRIGDKLAIGLPGHPVSALMMFLVVCAPAIRRERASVLEASVTMNIASQAGRDDFIPVQLKEDNGMMTALPLLGKSGLMSILALADGYIHIPSHLQGISAQQMVRVELF